MTSTVPYFCPLCLTEKGCGYHGVLWFEGADIPTCDHHTGDTNAPDSVQMQPVEQRHAANTHARRP